MIVNPTLQKMKERFEYLRILVSKYKTGSLMKQNSKVLENIFY